MTRFMAFASVALYSLLLALAPLRATATWAQFCDDTKCSVNCGQSVDVNNPGCLGESNRHSIKFHDNNFGDVKLVFTPDDHCSCQNDCIARIVSGLSEASGCVDLSGHAGATSFRFVGTNDDCTPNQC